jgi:hypothetical protein
MSPRLSKASRSVVWAPGPRACPVVASRRTGTFPQAEKQRAERDVALRDAIERVLLDFPGYGYRRVTQALRRAGWSSPPAYES